MQNTNTSLHRYAQFTVVAAFALILIGSLVTTNGAGMAFADWPLSSGSLNPEGWWSQLFQRLEHGHRLFAELTGLLVGILCAWVWGSRMAVPAAIIASGVLSAGAVACGVSPSVIAHIGLWSAALVFTVVLLLRNTRSPGSPSTLSRGLAFAAFCGVVVQAVIGGLRVTVESGGNPGLATALRIVHGCCAQLELCLLVGLAATLAPSWGGLEGIRVPGLARIRRLGWLTFGFILLQLILGATIRHLGIALVIPTFPLASPHGLMPAVHGAWIDLNFTHTRFLALVIAVHVVLLSLRILRTAPAESRLKGPAALLLALLVAQIAFGVTIIWTLRSVLPTTLHVINGAALLATSLLIVMRASRLQAKQAGLPEIVSGTVIQPEVLS